MNTETTQPTPTDERREWWQAQSWRSPDAETEVALDLGWGRLILGQTFADHERLLAVLSDEASGRRDICMYVTEPQVLVSLAPFALFIDPSVTYRLHFSPGDPPQSAPDASVQIRTLRDRHDADEINRLYASCGMLPAPPAVLLRNAENKAFHYLVAEEVTADGSTRILGTVTGLDHGAAFNDPQRGSSLWCLAADPQSSRPGIGEALVLSLAARLAAAGAAYVDLSVLHDNAPAIKLYEKLGFIREPVFCVKRKNPINERLFAASPAEDLAQLNPYARIVADEAIRRGIHVEVLDPAWGELRLTHGGRKVVTRESLSELTSAVAMSRCDDKHVTRRALARAGLSVPRGRCADGSEADTAFLAEVGAVVVKPSRGEQGQGITVGVTAPADLERAVETARRFSSEVLLEELVPGEDLRVLVIDHRVVAAAVRRPAAVIGSGEHTIRALIEAQSRRRAAVTGGESQIPLDELTAEVVAEAGYDLDDVLEADVELVVRRTANLHTGGTIHDVTAALHPELAAAAELASQVLDIPVVGMDFMVPSVEGPDYHVIEANERPGLANHEPQPTAQCFVDLLFPSTRPLPTAWGPNDAPADTDHGV
ncbi:N-acetylglutaminylglutamine synthetase [Sporichthya sp.]|uniref:N-acetylglutaminylglutamine synthetase n=1 Tax=Sporichthya sp. TaxID=65475 RepID=UPI0025E63AB2|nr:N-acetylglutaminylglutamine synthetase [Sporichthya sp.]